ncbi:hypothetical protein PENTCL1PPCAC_10153, partial [Pristionchus entomophagus]
YSSDCIRRIAKNVTIENLSIKFSDSTDFTREICNLIKEFRVVTLYFGSFKYSTTPACLKGEAADSYLRLKRLSINCTRAWSMAVPSFAS